MCPFKLAPPGAGTSMLACRLTTILPAMTLAEAIETTRIHSVTGLTGDRTALATTRPFRAPYHTFPEVRLIGRGGRFDGKARDRGHSTTSRR
jgi:magnesium chelatase family protein